MATAKEKEDIQTLKTDVAVMKTDIGYMKGDLKKVVDFVDENKSGIKTASLLDNKIVTTVVYGIVLAGIVIAARLGG